MRLAVGKDLVLLQFVIVPSRCVRVVVPAGYLAAALIVTGRLWADPGGLAVSGNPLDNALAAWFIRYGATAVEHGHLPALVTTALNAPRGANLMWNTSLLLPGVLLAPVTLLADPQASLTVLITAGFGGSAATMYLVLRRWDASRAAAAAGGVVYGFSPALLASSMAHYNLQFAVLPPLIIDSYLRIVTGRAGRPVQMGCWLGVLAAAQLFTGEELLADTAVAACVLTVVIALCSRPRPLMRMVPALAAAAGTSLVLCGYGLWIQFHGPLTQHGVPWNPDGYRARPYAFVTPPASLLLHTAASAATAARYAQGAPEYLAYLGWPMLLLLAGILAGCWRDVRIRVTGITFCLVELLSFGDGSSLLPGHWLSSLPMMAGALPDRFSILADGLAGALLAFALDLSRAWPVPRYLPAVAAAIAVLPVVPLPLSVSTTDPYPAGWSAVQRRLDLPPDAHVLVVPDGRQALSWQAQAGLPASIVGSGLVLEPGRAGQATSYERHRRLTAKYLAALWFGHRSRPPGQAQITRDLAYWHLAAVVTVTRPGSLLTRFLDQEFGPPAARDGAAIAWLTRPR